MFKNLLDFLHEIVTQRDGLGFIINAIKMLINFKTFRQKFSESKWS